MTTRDIIALEDAYQLPTYSKLPIALVRGEGSYVWDAEGNRYLDYYGGHCVTLLGHCPPAVVDAVSAQASKLLFYSNVVYSDVRARAAALVAKLAPEGLGHVFFCNSGTEANETALKLARRHTGRSGIVATKGGFHGRTLGSLAATWTPAYREPYQDVLPETHFVPFGDAGAVAEVLEARSDIAAMIIEPLQSMAGLTQAPDSYFVALRRLCDRHDVLLVFDEVQTGVGRTGTFSISEQVGVRPDLISLAKSLGSGVPVGAVLASDDIASGVRHGEQGTTFGGGMLAMAAVEATLQTILDQDLMPRARNVFEKLAAGVAPHAAEIRGRGCLLGIQLNGPVAPVLAALREQRVLAGSSGDPEVLRLMPPINTSDEEIREFVAAFEEAVHSSPVSAPAS